MKRMGFWVLWFLLAAGLLTACAPAGGDTPRPEHKDGILTYAALDPLTFVQERRIRKFNEEHPDAQIEVLDYSDEGGIDRLMTELALGWVPDIMELHRMGEKGEDRPYYYVGNYVGVYREPKGAYWMPYRQMVQNGYLEDLRPYIESDPKLGRDALLEAPVKAAEVDGGLYMLFKDVWIETLAGSESVVGNRNNWTMEELMEAFSAMPDGSTILRYNATRWEMYSSLFCTTLDQYIDWEKGQCSFDNDEFRSMLEFLGTFPTEFETTITPTEVKEEIVWRRLEGEQMLEAVVISLLTDMAQVGTTFGGKRVVYVGYPTADGSSGSFFHIPGTVLAMSSSCSDKEAAWEFMGYLVRNVYSPGTVEHKSFDADADEYLRMPINLKNYKHSIHACLHYDAWKYSTMRTFPGGPELKVEPLTEDDILPFETLINNTKQLYWPNDALSDTVWDAIGPYFAGDKTMDETIRLVENRVTLYVNENR